MPLSEYERFRQSLEEQLRADVELLYQAYCAKLRAYETVWRALRVPGAPQTHDVAFSRALGASAATRG